MTDTKVKDNQISFSFQYFKEESVRIQGFNNYYENKIESINSVNDFIDTIRAMCKYSKERLFSNDIKKFFHLNYITDEKTINLIEKVLINGYGLSQTFVDNFERTYIEFSTKNGKRVIASLMYGCLFECLFLDPNHLIYPAKARFIKKKNLFNTRSAFQKWDEDLDCMHEPLPKDYIEMVIDDYENNKIKTAEEAIETIKEIIVEDWS